MKQYFGEATPKLGFGLMRLPKAVQDIFRKADPKASFALSMSVSFPGLVSIIGITNYTYLI